MVKRVIAAVAFVICALGLNAQTKNISEFVNLVKQGAQVHFSFAQSNINMVPVVGNVSVKGNCYRMQMDNGILVVNNGDTEWYVNADKTEIVIYNSQKDSNDITRNPFAFLEAAQDMYKVVLSGQYSNKVPRKITLTAKNGVEYTIEIIGFNELQSTDFTLDTNLYPQATITDLR